MPDGLSHTLLNYILFKKQVGEKYLLFFLAGSILPDIMLRGGRLLFLFHPDKDFLELYLTPLHTPATILLICLIISLFFKSAMRFKVFLNLWLGCLAHFLFDFLQKSIYGSGLSKISYNGYHWLYPFSNLDAQYGIFWAEDSLYFLIILAPVALGIFLKEKINSDNNCINGAAKWQK